MFSKLPFIFIIFMSLSSGCLSQPQRNLGQYRWNKRIIVTYALSEEHPEVLKLKSDISRRLCEYDNRNLVHEHVNTSENDFKIILIGYDGATKYTGRQSDLQALFDLIDTMPMRRAEMRNDKPCY